MTSREWQHAIYFRDRWTPTSKLTLDLGVRWESYPLMTRAEGRGLELLDLNTLEVIIGGRGNNPKNVGPRCGPGQLRAAPRRYLPAERPDGAARRLRCDVQQHGLGPSDPWRPAYPITLATTFTQPLTFMYYNTLGQGIPSVVGPDQSSGRVALPNAVGMTTPELGNVDRGKIHTWNIAFERRLPLDISVDVAYVGAKGVGGYGWVDANLPTTLGGGAQSRPYFISHGRQLDTNVWGAILDTDYDSLQVAINRPFKNRFMLKGAYTYSRSMNETDADGRTGLAFGAHPLYRDRSWALAGFDRPHNFQSGFVYQLPWQSERRLRKPREGNFRRLAAERRLRRLQRHAVLRHRERHLVEHAGHYADRQFSGGDLNVLGKIGAAGTWFDTTQFSQPTGVTIGNSTRNQFRGPGGWTLDMSRRSARFLGQHPPTRIPRRGGEYLQPPGVRKPGHGAAERHVRADPQHPGRRRHHQRQRVVRRTADSHRRAVHLLTRGAPLRQRAPRSPRRPVGHPHRAFRFFSRSSDILRPMIVPTGSVAGRAFARAVCPAITAMAMVVSAQSAQPLPSLALDRFPEAARAAVSGAYQAARKQPSDAKAVGALAQNLQAWEQWDTAHQVYLRAQALAPGSLEWHYLDAVVLQRMARHAEAAERLRAAITISLSSNRLA